MQEQPECGCGKSASFFHSRCCNAHFEGVIYENGKYAIVCEKCQKFCAFIDQLPPVQPEGRSREEICQAIDDYLKKNPSWGPSGDLWISRRALSEVVAKLFVEQEEEKTDETR